MSWLIRSKKKKLASLPSPKWILFKQILFGSFLVFLVVGLFYGVWRVSRIDAFTIINVEVIGGETISHEVVKEKAEALLIGEYYRLVPRRFSFTYPREKIISEIISIPRVKNVHAELKDGETLVIAFEEYQPFALWCKELVSKQCLFLDDSGYAFSEAPYLEGTAFLRYSDKNRTPQVGENGFETQFIKDTNLFVTNAYDSLKLNIIQVEKTADDELSYHVAGGGLIKVTTRMTTKETLENLEVILKSKEFSHLEPGNFKYIDLRYGNKIFVNEVLEEDKKEPASSTKPAGL